MTKNFKEVPIEEINHYQVLVLKNLIDDKYSEEAKFTHLDDQIESAISKQAELYR